MRNSHRLLLAGLVAIASLSGCASPRWPWAKADAAGDNLASADEKAAAAASVKNPLALARLSERRGQTEQAAALYQEAIRRTPQNAEPYHRLAVMQARRGQFAEAERNFTQALSICPDGAQIHGDAGYFRYLNSQLPEAERHLRRAMELDPNNAAYANNLALVLGEQGRYADCFNLFRRTGSETQAHANMAFVLAQHGEYQRALEAYNRVLSADPKNRPAAEAMIELSKLIASKQPQQPGIAQASSRANGVVQPEASIIDGRAVLVSYQAPATQPAPWNRTGPSQPVSAWAQPGTADPLPLGGMSMPVGAWNTAENRAVPGF